MSDFTSYEECGSTAKVYFEAAAILNLAYPQFAP